MPLVTLAQVLLNGLPTILGTGVESVVNDDLIAEAEATLAARLLFPRADDGAYHLDTTTYTSFVAGPRPGACHELPLPMRPVVAITTVHRSTERTYDATTLVAAADYSADLDRGVLVSTYGVTGWYSAYRAQRVVYTAGLGTTGLAPKPVILAVAYQVQAILTGRRHGPVVNQVQDGQETTDPQLAAVDARAWRLISQYCLWEQTGAT